MVTLVCMPISQFVCECWIVVPIKVHHNDWIQKPNRLPQLRKETHTTVVFLKLIQLKTASINDCGIDWHPWENMHCLPFLTTLNSIPTVVATPIRIYNIAINILSLLGNTILIWALRRTRQTKTISFQFIIVMSASDITSAILSMTLLTTISFRQYQKYCWLTLSVQAVLNACNYFSTSMIFLIALDRYLHMKYLEQYSRKFTKRRGHLLIVIFLVLALFFSNFFILPHPPFVYSILATIYFAICMLFLISIIILYHKALATLRRKAHLVTSSIINKNRALGKAANRISLCIIALAGPIIILQIIDGVNVQLSFIDPSLIAGCTWFAYISFLGNGFCSSIIFISQNTPIRRFIRKVAVNNWNRIRLLGGRVGASTSG